MKIRVVLSSNHFCNFNLQKYIESVEYMQFIKQPHTINGWLFNSFTFQNLGKYDVKHEIYRDNAICSYLLYGNDMCTQNTTTYVLGRFICKKDNTNVCNYYSSPVRIIAAFNVSLASIFLFCSQINHTQKLHLMISRISFSELKT